METIKYGVIPIIWAFSSISTVLCIFSLLIRAILKKNTKKTKRNLIISVAIAILSFAVICTYIPSDRETTEPIEQGNTSVIESSGEREDDQKTFPDETVSFVLGDSKENPIKITADELVAEINTDIDNAKERFNGKWVQITGTITDTSIYQGDIFGYYVYGKNSTTGYTGLRILCWCDGGPYSGSVLGDTQTFVGKVLEITTVNATEIVDCEIVKE